MNKFIFFYSEKSHLSQNETSLYKDLSPRIEFIDIHSEEFKPYSDRVSVAEAAGNRIVILENGKVLKGLEALLAAWERIPKMAFLVPIVSSFQIKPFAKIAFQVYKKNLK